MDSEKTGSVELSDGLPCLGERSHHWLVAGLVAALRSDRPEHVSDDVGSKPANPAGVHLNDLKKVVDGLAASAQLSKPCSKTRFELHVRVSDCRLLLSDLSQAMASGKSA